MLARVLLGCCLATQQPRVDSTLHAIRDAEDARAATSAQLAVLRDGAHDSVSKVRRIAVRALGRLRRPELIPELVRALDDASPSVRASAATALLDASGGKSSPVVRAALLAHLRSEDDAAVTGAIAEALGWTSQLDSAQVRETAEAIVARSYARRGMVESGDAPPIALHGVAHGLFGLARQRVARRAMPMVAVRRLMQLAEYRRGAKGPRTEAEIRELAGMAIAAGEHASEPMLESLLADAEWSVRATVQRAVLFGTLVDSAAAERIVKRAAADRAWQVRTLAVSAADRRFGTRRGCALYLGAVADSNVAVRLPAVDALRGDCGAGSPAIALLDSLASTLPIARDGDAGAWHVPAHALVSLATVAPARALSRIPRFVASPSFFVREYAARAATKARDTATLRRLAVDVHPNVRSSAVAGLSALVGHAADDVYIAALASDDSQLLQAAEHALEKSADPRAVPALREALRRVTATGSETLRDARVALVDRLRELGDSSAPPAFRAPARAAVPSEREIASLARERLVLEMADGGTIVIRFFADDAPTNVARTVRLARAGRYDGLTFHRVILGRFEQGGSPSANEYAGWGTYTRDEFARPHVRGALSMSSRGDDTNDGQLVLHVSDNFDFDHAYTVIGEIVRGQEVVDRALEGATIRRGTVR